MNKLYAHQQKFLEKNPSKRLLCWDTGTGKTRMAIEWAKQNFATQIIVVCPKALVKNWVREIIQHNGNQLNPWIVYSKEEFRRDWEDAPKAEVLIIDEAHYFAGMRNIKKISQMARSLNAYIKKHNPQYILLLTATPYLSTPWNIFMLAKHLGVDWNYRSFKNHFFEDVYIGIRIISKVKEDIEADIAALVKEIGDVIKIDECVDVPDQVFDFEQFELTEVQKKRKKQIVEVNPIVRYTKYHQIENGTLKSDGYTEDEFIKNNKNDRIYELAQQVDKIAIVCRYNLQIDFLKEHLKDIGKEIYVIRGDVKNRDDVVQEVEKSSKCILLINASCSEGYELPSIGLIVFASLSFSYKDYKQMLGRFLRINNLKKNVYLHLVSGEVDESVYESIMAKKDFDIHIYAK